MCREGLLLVLIKITTESTQILGFVPLSTLVPRRVVTEESIGRPFIDHSYEHGKVRKTTD